MTKRIGCALVALVFFSITSTLVAQRQRQNDPVALKAWPAPLFWQPTRTESDAATGKADAFSSLKSDTVSATVPVGALVFVAMTPCRIVDTRDGTFPTGFGPPSLSGGATRTFAIQSSSWTCPVPPVAQAYSFNITVVPPGATFPGNVNPSGALSYLTIWPTGIPQPAVSTLNSFLGTVVANAAIVPAGTSGSVDVFVSHNTDFILDINGFYAPQSSITLAQGSAGAPTLSFAGDPGTGIFSSAVGTVNIATGGTSRITVRSDGDLDLAGNIRKGGNLFLHNLGFESTGVGLSALRLNTGNRNTAIGYRALYNNTGSNNTASGWQALFSNTTGDRNVASGLDALYSNTTGFANTASGVEALLSNTTGIYNTATGLTALVFNTTGEFNTATGSGALTYNTTGSRNTASGLEALSGNTTGGNNTASGFWALLSNKTGNNNTASGSFALRDNTTGSRNAAFGYSAGQNATTGSYNLFLGADVFGMATDSNTIRIGLPYSGASGQNRSFIAGIRGITTGSSDAVPVVIDSNGQLGTISSSRRFKEDIHDMAESSKGLLTLHPVTFRYKQTYADGSKPIEYGLIAEEVAEVYPDLVVKGADGQVETVQYQKLTPMLLNELQKLNKQREADHHQLQSALEQLESDREEIRSLKVMLAELAQKVGEQK